MRKNIYVLITVLLLSNEVLSKNGGNPKNIKSNHKKAEKRNGKAVNERGKRSLNEIEKSFLSQLNKGNDNEDLNGLAKFTSEEEKSLDNEPPFWGTRGRRDDSSENLNVKDQNIEVKCRTCDKFFHDFHKNVIKEELDPFWFERGVKDKSKELGPFWANRGRRDEMEPFWGNRGRRDEMDPFWGNRGRRDETDPFWGNRGRRDEMEPFWGNRGRRDEVEPFWGTRGRRNELRENDVFWKDLEEKQEYERILGSRSRREIKNYLHGNPYRSQQGWNKLALKEKIIKAMDNIKYGIENLARVRRMGGDSFWNNQGRDSKLETLFTQQAKNKNLLMPNKLSNRPVEQNTILDERMFAEQPHYIIIERSSRSSAEDDPFFISRGKKYTNTKFAKGFRDRRGVLEELVKSVRTDPYYIARGKKDSGHFKIGNSTKLKSEFVKGKELICSAVDLLVIKNHKMKRDVDESERERRTILKKLAAQLQMDPYFVSRGKKNGVTDVNDEHLEEFISHVSNMCN